MPFAGGRSIAARFEAAKKAPEDQSGATEVIWTWHDEARAHDARP